MKPHNLLSTLRAAAAVVLLACLHGSLAWYWTGGGASADTVSTPGAAHSVGTRPVGATVGASAAPGGPAPARPAGSGLVPASTAVPPVQAAAHPLADAPLPAGHPLADAPEIARRLQPEPGGGLIRERIVARDSGQPPVRLRERIAPDGTVRIEEALVADHLIASFETEADRAELKAAVEQAGLTVRAKPPLSSFILVANPAVSFESLDDTRERIERAAGAGLNLSVDPVAFIAVQPNDPYFSSQYGLSRIDAPTAWNTATGDPETVVAIVDTGVHITHPDLAPVLWTNPGEVPGNGVDDDLNGYVDDVHGVDFIDMGTPVNDTHGHGTHVAGIAAAAGNNGQGIAGVAWNARIMGLRVSSQSSSDFSVITMALDYMNFMKTQRGVPIVSSNHSYAGTFPADLFRLYPLWSSYVAHRDAGILKICASGNDNNNNDLENRIPSDLSTADWPGAGDWDNIISVGGTDQNDNRYSSSNYGAERVEMAAPAVSILSTLNNGGYGYKTGTSMAAPHVAGAVAVFAAANPELSGRELRDLLLGTVEPVNAWNGKSVTGGRLDLAAGTARAASLDVPGRSEDYVAWSFDYFGDILGGATSPEALPSADPEGDGLSNLAEYFHGADPFAFSPPGERIEPGFVKGLDGKFYLELRFRRRVEAAGVASGEGEPQETVELNLDPAGGDTWMSGPEYTETVGGSIASEGDFEWVTVRSKVPLGDHDVQLMRLRVQAE